MVYLNVAFNLVILCIVSSQCYIYNTFSIKTWQCNLPMKKQGLLLKT